MSLRDVEAERHLATVAALDLALGALCLLFALPTLLVVPVVGAPAAFAALGLMLLAVVHLLLWRGLPARSPAARRTQLALAALAVPLVPLGTAWGAYVLGQLACARGRALFAAPPPRERPPAFAALVALGVAAAGMVFLGVVVVRVVAAPTMGRALASAADAAAQADEEAEEAEAGKGADGPAPVLPATAPDAVAR